MAPIRSFISLLYVQIVLSLAYVVTHDPRRRRNGRDARTPCREVASALAALPARQRSALVQRRYHGRSYAEVAVALQSSEEDARANVYAALRALRNRLPEATGADHDEDWPEIRTASPSPCP
jgi:DNA-directed RNA polymerase specialized sigma24 family protein